MSIIERSIRQPVAVTVVVLLLMIFGLVGLSNIPVQLTPTVDQPVVSITTMWFGRSPQEIEQEILLEQEEVLREVKGVREMKSIAREGQGEITLKFYVGVDKEVALNEVRDKLRQVPEYPADVDEPVVDSVDSNARNYIAWIILRPRPGEKVDLSQAPKFADNVVYNGDATELFTFAEDNIKPLLKRTPGVAEVNVLGGREREMQVRVDLERLASRGISVVDFDAALRRENLNVTAGTMSQGKRDTSVRAMGQYESPEQIRNTIIAYSESGAPVYVRDVAEVVQSYKEQKTLVRSLGETVLAVNVKMETGGNVLDTMRELKKSLAQVQTEVLDPRKWGLELHQVYDQSLYVEQSRTNVTHDLLVGAALSAGVLFLTLRSFGATVVVALSIPISIVGTFLGMYLTGRNLNVISMAGLSFAIGMGVDNTIVVLENIFRHREMGKTRLQAALDGTQEVWGAIVAATLANIAVFLPVVFIEEEAGQLFRDIAIAISISLFLYMVVSPTVIPMLATLFLRRMPAGFVEKKEEGGDAKRNTILGRLTAPVARIGGVFSQWFYNLILWLTGGWVRRVLLCVVMVALAGVGSWALMPPRTYLPEGNQNLVFGFIVTPPGYSVEEYQRMGKQIEAFMRPWWEAEPGSEEMKKLQQQWVYARDNFMVPGMQQMLDGQRQGKSEEEFRAAAGPLLKAFEELKSSPAPAGIENFFFVTTPFGVFMGMSSEDPQNVASLKFLFNGAIQGIPGVIGFPTQAPIFQTDNSFGGGIEVNVVGADNAQVQQAAEVLQGALFMGFQRFVRSDPQSFNLGRPETQVIPDRVRSAAAGVNTAEIRELAQVAVDGAYVGDYREGSRSIDLTVVANDPSLPGDPEMLANVPIATRVNGVRGITTLASVAELRRTSAPTQINRSEEQPAITLNLPLVRGETMEEVTSRIEDEIVPALKAQGAFPAGVSVKLTGSADKLEGFNKNFVPDTSSFRAFFMPESGLPGGAFGMAAIITYLLLAALFESFLHPFVIIMSVPFALVGGFAGLWVLHRIDPIYTLDVLTMLGFVILVGTIVNNPILIVHQALNYMREGMDRQHAIALSTQTRVRPIFMSVITSVAGMTPLVIFAGPGSELYRGLGAVVVGGLLVSTVFTLLLTPTLMSLMLDLQAGVGRLFGGGGGGGAKAPRKVVEAGTNGEREEEGELAVVPREARPSVE